MIVVEMATSNFLHGKRSFHGAECGLIVAYTMCGGIIGTMLLKESIFLNWKHLKVLF